MKTTNKIFLIALIGIVCAMEMLMRTTPYFTILAINAGIINLSVLIYKKLTDEKKQSFNYSKHMKQIEIKRFSTLLTF